MAVVTLTNYGTLPSVWQQALFPKREQAVRKLQKFTKAARERCATKVYRFHIIHRQTAGHCGPGRRHKRR